MDAEWLDPVRAALDAAPAPVDVFFRDDDAGWGDERLLELLGRFAARGLPVDVAVIPAALGPALAAELRARGAGLHQHGFAHTNHEVHGRKCEFGPSRPAEDQRRDIARGRERLAELLNGAMDPIFTPPWNRCTADTAAAVAELGFAALSREAKAEPFGVPGLAELPVHVDWARLTPRELGERLADVVRGGGPAGVMFHHAVMDPAEMGRADELLALIAAHPHARPRAMRDLAA